MQQRFIRFERSRQLARLGLAAAAVVTVTGVAQAQTDANTTRPSLPRPTAKSSINHLLPPSLQVPSYTRQDPATEMKPTAQAQIAALMQEKANRTPAQKKISSSLLFTRRMYKGEEVAPGVRTLRSKQKVDMVGRVTVEVRAAAVGPELLDAIRTAGGQVVRAYPRFKSVRALLPLNTLEQVAARPEVRFIAPAVPNLRDQGIAQSEGDTTHLSALVRKELGADGTGVKIGVLSDSDDYSDNSIATGDLPANYAPLLDADGNPLNGQPGSGEGTAMMEIIHDVVPGSELVFATFGFDGPEMAQNVLDLRAAGCDVIVDDRASVFENPFQDGPIAQAVNQVTADGALYFASAGNQGNRAVGTASVWEGDFRDGGNATGALLGAGRVHRFGNGPAGLYNFNRGAQTIVELWWADPLGASDNDYDVYMLDETGSFVYDARTDIQDGIQDPVEGDFGFVTFPGDRLYVVRYAGAPRAMHFAAFRSGGAFTFTTGGAVRGHNSAIESVAVAAVDAYTSFPFPYIGRARDFNESFSSDGPRRKFYEEDGTPITPGNFLFATNGGRVMQKPDISAADGVATTTPGFYPFFGTSAAAPHAAAIAALIKSYGPTLSNDEVKDLMKTTAFDIQNVGFDVRAGHGLIMAYPAVIAVRDFIVPGSVRVSNVTQTAATVSWRTTMNADGRVFFGTTPALGSIAPGNAITRTHSVTLNALTPGTNYNFRVASTSFGGGLSRQSENATFRTLSLTQSGLVVGGAALSRDPQTGDLVGTVTITNPTTAPATSVQVTNATVGAAATTSPMPASVADIPAGGNGTVTLRFASLRPGTQAVLRVTGRYVNGITGATVNFSASTTVSVP